MKNKITLFILISVLFSSVGFSQSPAVKLIAFSYDDSQVKISKWNAGESTFSSSVLTNVTGVLGGSSTYDANTGSYFAKVLDNSEPENQNKLFEYNTSDDSILLTDTESFFNGGTEVDMETGLIYTYDGDENNNVYLNQYNPVTGVSTNLGFLDLGQNSGFYPDSTCYDSNTKKYYFLTASIEGTKIVTVQVDSSPLIYSIVALDAPISVQGNIGLEFSNTSNTIYVQYLTFNETLSTSTANLGALDPVTGSLTNLLTVDTISAYVMFNRTFDQESQSLYFVSYDMNDGSLDLVKFDTVNLTYEMMSMPAGNIVELEADNYNYAVAKYGLLATNQLDANSINVYPNPASDFISINFEGSDLNYSIIDMYGKEVSKGLISKNQKIDVTTLSKGIYCFKFIDTDKTYSKKILIN